LSVTDVDFIKDLIHLRYDPAKLTQRRIVEVIRKQGFEATITPRRPAEGKGKGN
jgi:hypothetical protein